ncbi:hypothetical protein [Chromobacterium piscinae]|uniref:hypothetical protein n=1 Tax=Chromobacterium piscinae TaxID=686831 RepID=UPI003F811D87
MNSLGISTPWEVLLRTLETGQPSRKVVKRHGCTYRSNVPTTKAILGHIPCESTLERQAIEWFVQDSRVVRIAAQPGPFTLADGTQYTPDFLVMTCSGRILLLEIKWEEELLIPGVCSKLLRAKSDFDRHNIEFHVLIDSTIRNPSLRDNIRALKVIAHLEVPPLILGTLYSILRVTPRVPFSTLSTRINSPHYVRVVIARGLLHINLQQPFNNETLVSLGGQP